jgi:hypothetical protein
VEFRPRLDIGRPHGCQHRDAGLHGAYESGAEAAALDLGGAEPVQHQQFDIVAERPVEQRADFGQALRIEPAAFGLGSQVLRNPVAPP